MDQLAPTTSTIFLANKAVTACHTSHTHSHRDGASQQLQFLLCSQALEVLTCTAKDATSVLCQPCRSVLGQQNNEQQLSPPIRWSAHGWGEPILGTRSSWFMW